MEMKQISETTLKIMITMEDLEEHGMELKDFLIPQEKTEEFFYTVMDELDLPDNFKNSGMLSFRVTPRKDRVDVFVTKSDLKEDLDFNDLSEAIPCYVCIIAMPFFYSISEGISMAIITYVVLNLLTGKAKEKKLSLLMYILAILFVLKYAFL